MAIGAITLVTQKEKNGKFYDQISFAGDGAYPTGGTAAFQAALRTKCGDNRTISAVHADGLNGGYEIVYDKANDKLIAVVKSSGVETANAVDLSATTFKLRIESF